MSEITVVAKARAKSGCEKDLESALRTCVKATHAEKGCIRYTLQRGADDPTLFAVVERWASRHDHETHMKTPHVAALFAAVAPLVAEAPEILVLAPFDAGLPEKGRL
jgi:quinol monooxygenase YgiN